MMDQNQSGIDILAEHQLAAPTDESGIDILHEHGLKPAHGIDWSAITNAPQETLLSKALYGIQHPSEIPGSIARKAKIGLGAIGETAQDVLGVARGVSNALGLNNPSANYNLKNLMQPGSELAKANLPQGPQGNIDFSKALGYGQLSPMEQLAQNLIPLASTAPIAMKAPEILKGAVSAVKAPAQLFNFMRPKEQAKTILKELGQGKSIAENTHSIINDLKSAYNERIAQSAANYAPVDAVASGEKIYPNDKALTQSNYFKTYFSSPKIQNSINHKVEQSHNDFLVDPTYDNAHKLQSDIGKAIGVEKGKGFNADRDKLSVYNDLRDAVKNDVASFLDKYSPDLANQYKAASDYHLKEVIPYRSTSNIIKAIQNKDVNESSLLNAFKSAHTKRNVQKIISDLGPEFQNKLIYARLAKESPRSNPYALLDAFKRLKEPEQSYGAHITPRLYDQMRSLESKILKRSYFRKGVTATAGLLGVGKGVKNILNSVPESISIEGQGGQE
jgi:hypothetical protein